MINNLPVKDLELLWTVDSTVLVHSYKNVDFSSQDDSIKNAKNLIFMKNGTFRVECKIKGINQNEWHPRVKERKRIYGIIGLLDLGFGKYLIYIEQLDMVANIGNRSIYRILKCGHAVVSRNIYLTLHEEYMENEILSSAMTFLSSGLFYISFDFDITSSSQRHFSNLLKNGCENSFYYSLFDSDFWWTKSLLSPFLSDSDYLDFIAPIIAGHVFNISNIYTLLPSINTHIDIIMISRISCKRVLFIINNRPAQDIIVAV
jgi:hypothetical protein